MHSVLAGDYAGPLKPTRKEITVGLFKFRTTQ